MRVTVSRSFRLKVADLLALRIPHVTRSDPLRIGTEVTDALGCGIGFYACGCSHTGWKPLPLSVPTLTD